jgi:D-arabinose 1-dehydrogenase-like Zn-dependent alcohol dehydrogenase
VDRFLVKNVLARGGTIVPLAAPTSGPLSLPADKMFWDVYHVHSSLVASRARHEEMLQFAAVHNVEPMVEISKHTGADSITKAIERLELGKVRYRLVLAFE